MQALILHTITHANNKHEISNRLPRRLSVKLLLPHKIKEKFPVELAERRKIVCREIN